MHEGGKVIEDDAGKLNVDGLTSEEYQEHLYNQAREEIELILSAKDYQLFTNRFGMTRGLAVRQCKQVVLELQKQGSTIYLKCLDKSG